VESKKMNVNKEDDNKNNLKCNWKVKIVEKENEEMG
jgi:hypothetical protein